MKIKAATPQDMDAIYLMGFDTWGDDMSLADYLAECRGSDKYALGEWFVLTDKEQPVASLIVYSGVFGLAQNSFGLGSIATEPAARGRGYGSQLTRHITELLFKDRAATAIYLHSDIDTGFYARLGYQCVAEGDACMCRTPAGEVPVGARPDYF